MQRASTRRARVTTRARRARTVQRHRWWTPWLFLVVPLAVTVLFSLFPFVNTVVLSFTNATPLGGGEFTGLANYREMTGDGQFWLAVRNSTLFMVVVVPLMVLLPLFLALLVAKQIPGIAFFRATFYTPVVASAVVVGLVWSWALGTQGLVNGFLESMRWVNEPVGFLTDAQLLLFSTMAVTVWKGLGYYMVIYLAALANVPKELHEAAALDGAGAVRRFRSVTVPALRSTMILVGTLSAISAFRVFTELYVMSNGSGGPGQQSITLVFLIQMVGRGLDGSVGYASALSLVLFVITLGFSLLLLRLNRTEDRA
ncbi:ABC transporter permease subunit [Longispora albida]|uniref:carbohydrate ABC transporter permease n=1 Tax=Longispora albida TaxID=203523 RepID=UPI00037CA022